MKKTGNKKRRSQKQSEIHIEVEGRGDGNRKPAPPNVFLYIQLARIWKLPVTSNSLEIHLQQGENIFVKCTEEHYNKDGIIYQHEFDKKPTFTLIVPQDNIEHINQASDNPLLLRLYMRVAAKASKSTEEGGDASVNESGRHDSSVEVKFDASSMTTGKNENVKHNVSSNRSNRTSSSRSSTTEAHSSEEEKERLELLSLGYIDILKLFARRRSMMKEELYLYSVPSVPNALRTTTHTEWHLYTLLPLLKEIQIANLAFITLESIYNTAIPNVETGPKLFAEFTFRSTVPNEKKEYHTVPLCQFKTFVMEFISMQSVSHVFESLRTDMFGNAPVHALNSSNEVELYTLFNNLLRSEGMELNLEFMDPNADEALICNSFHRFVLTREMSSLLNSIFVRNRYVLVISLYRLTEPRRKIYEGILNPAVLAYPNIKTVRFAVELRYVGSNKKSMKKRNTLVSLYSTRSRKSRESSAYPLQPTFAIVKICLFSPIGEANEELLTFNESFVSQNRLQFCDALPKETIAPSSDETREDAYKRFDKFTSDTAAYIISKNIISIEEKKQHFCCATQNLMNVLLKVVGSDFNRREPTKTNVEFTNVCVNAYNELENRLHDRVERFCEGGIGELVLEKDAELEKLIDYMNTIKTLHEIGEAKLSDVLYNKILDETKLRDTLSFFKLVHDMEHKDYEAAKQFFDKSVAARDVNVYFANWIKLYLNYIEMKTNEETLPNATEFLLRDITAYAEQYHMEIDGWILLYCYYKRFKYWPGVEYARWHYENNLKLSIINAAGSPYSLNGTYCGYLPYFENLQTEIFFGVLRIFVRLGLYEFAEIIYDTIKSEFKDVEQYLFSVNLKVINKTLEDDFIIRSFPFDDTEEGIKLAGYINQTNGNVEYYRGNYTEAQEYYMRNISIPVVEDERDYFLLSSFRLACLTLKDGDYPTTIRALSKPITGNIMPMVANFIIGRAYYKHDDLQNALESFIKCTTYNTHLPDIWGYLALINLRMGQNFYALECWKYARINPISVIDDEIYEQLEQINLDDVDLYVDVKD